MFSPATLLHNDGRLPHAAACAYTLPRYHTHTPAPCWGGHLLCNTACWLTPHTARRATAHRSLCHKPPAFFYHHLLYSQFTMPAAVTLPGPVALLRLLHALEEGQACAVAPSSHPFWRRTPRSHTPTPLPTAATHTPTIPHPHPRYHTTSSPFHPHCPLLPL